MYKTRGIIFTMLSAVIFGFTPILARIAYDGGSNGVTMAFLRSVLSLPVLIGILKYKGLSLKPTPQQFRNIVLAGGVGSALATILLYSSYKYIPVGMATTLHFVYPLLVALLCVFFLRERLDVWKIAALVAGTAGVAFFMERGSSAGILGVVLALASGVVFAFHVFWVDRSGLKNMYYYQLVFYLCICIAVVSGVFGTATGMLTFRLTPKAWLYSLLVSLFVSVAGLSMFQLGIRYIGATSASILSTLEPITSVVLGILVLGESVSPLKLTGCALILVSVICIARSPEPPGHGTERATED